MPGICWLLKELQNIQHKNVIEAFPFTLSLWQIYDNGLWCLNKTAYRVNGSSAKKAGAIVLLSSLSIKDPGKRVFSLTHNSKYYMGKIIPIKAASWAEKLLRTVT